MNNQLSALEIRGSNAIIKPMQIPEDWDLKDGDHTLSPHMLVELALSDLSTLSKTDQDVELVKMKRLIFAAGLKFLEESSPMFKEITMADFCSDISGLKELQMPDGHKERIIVNTSVEFMTKIAYSNYFKSFIKCTRHISDDNWFFCLCDEKGKERSGIMRARSNYKCFDWKEIDK